jgi:hypothetical protein
MECSCEYCLKRFVNKNTLKNHQLNAKYCLKIQGKITMKNEVIDVIKYICGTCTKQSSTKEIHKRHISWCIETLPGQVITKLRNDIEKIRTDNDKLQNNNYSKEGMIALMQDKIDRQEAKIISFEQSLTDINVLQTKVDIYKNQADEKQECIEQIAKQPKMTTNNNILNMHTLDLSNDRVENMIEEYYSIDYLLAGAKGVAQFTVDKVLTKPDDKIIYSLTDRSREAYNFKNVEGVIEKDTKGRKLREVVYKNGIKEKAFSIANNMVLKDPIKAVELRCIEYALEVADLDPSTIRTKEVNDKVEHAYCKELRETSC